MWACGTLGRAHGLKGELYLNLMPHGLEYLSQGSRFSLVLEGAESPVPVELFRVGGTDRRPLVRLGSVDSRDEALRVQGATVLAEGGPLDDLSGVRVGDLIGVRALCGAVELGIVSDVIPGVANEIIEIKPQKGPAILVPLVDEVVEIDLEGRVLRIREGFL